MTLRAFVAVELPDAARGRLVTAGNALVDVDPAWSGEKWVVEENLHITLRFIGPLDEADVTAVVSALRLAAADSDPFALSMSRVEAVPSPSRARMLWAAGGGDVQACASFALRIADALEPWAGETERRPFRPHVTLARARRARPVLPGALEAATHALTSDIAPGEGAVSVRSATLFSSTLGSRGPTYESIQRVPIGSD